MKKNIYYSFLLIFIFALTSCSTKPKFKYDDIILYDNNKYFDTGFYVTENGPISPNGDLEKIGSYPCEMAFYLPKPIYKISNDENNDLLFVYGVGLPLYVYSKNDFTSPNYSNFYISSVEYDDVCLDFEEEITISDIFNNDISFNYKDLEIVNECKCKFSSTNYPFFLMNIDILIDSNGNNYIKSLDSSEYYLIKEKYKIF